MIVVDTSVWVSFLRDERSPVRSTLERLLDDDAVLLPRLVKVELLAGAGGHSLPVLHRTLSALQTLTPSADTWALIEHWVTRAAARGLRFGVGDLLVAACAAERGALLWSLDHDFDPMVKQRWIRRFVPLAVPRPTPRR